MRRRSLYRCSLMVRRRAAPSRTMRRRAAPSRRMRRGVKPLSRMMSGSLWSQFWLAIHLMAARVASGLPVRALRAHVLDSTKAASPIMAADDEWRNWLFAQATYRDPGFDLRPPINKFDYG